LWGGLGWGSSTAAQRQIEKRPSFLKKRSKRLLFLVLHHTARPVAAVRNKNQKKPAFSWRHRPVPLVARILAGDDISS
jgi:hypothetical protein